MNLVTRMNGHRVAMPLSSRAGDWAVHGEAVHHLPSVRPMLRELRRMGALDGDTPAERYAALRALRREHGLPVPPEPYAIPPEPKGPEVDPYPAAAMPARTPGEKARRRERRAKKGVGR